MGVLAKFKFQSKTETERTLGVTDQGHFSRSTALAQSCTVHPLSSSASSCSSWSSLSSFWTKIYDCNPRNCHYPHSRLIITITIIDIIITDIIILLYNFHNNKIESDYLLMFDSTLAFSPLLTTIARLSLIICWSLTVHKHYHHYWQQERQR